MSAIYGFNHYYGSTSFNTDGEANAYNVSIDTNNFTTILNGTDTDLQKALETLDKHKHPAVDITTDTSTWTGDILTSTETQVQAALNRLNTYLETNTSFINYAGLPDKYAHVRIGNNQTIAETTGGVCIGSGAETGIGPEIGPNGYGSVVIGNGIGTEFEVGPWSEGPNSICIGMGANSSFSGGIAIGLASSAASGCTAIGFNSCRDNVSGSGCTALGYYSLQTNSGIFNTAIGYSTMSECTTCTDNVAMGYMALMYASGATFNVAIGEETMKGNASFKITGDYNVAIGPRSLYGSSAVLSGIRNVGIGFGPLTSLTSGGDNVCIGYSAGSNISTGSSNVCIGNISKASTNIDYAVSIGYDASVTGTNGIGIGRATRAAANSISIGYNVNAAANTTAIGNSSCTDTYLPNKVNGVGPEYSNSVATGSFNTITFKYPTVHKFVDLSTSYVELGLNITTGHMCQMALLTTNNSVGLFWMCVGYDMSVPKYVCTHTVGANVSITQTASYPEAYFEITVGGDAAVYTLHINTGSAALTRLKCSALRSGTTQLKVIRYVM